MIVVTILGILAGGIALAVFPRFRDAQIKTAHTNAKTLRVAANLWRSEHSDDAACPTVNELRSAQVLDDASCMADPWGTTYKIECRETQTVVISLGPDKKVSADDIVEPEPIALAAQ